MKSKIQNLAIVGFGQMGAGIAQISAQQGINVTMIDRDEQALATGMKYVEKSVSRVAKKLHKNDLYAANNFKNSLLKKISITTDLEKGTGEQDLVIEAIIENLKIKQNLFQKIDKISNKKTIFASNTSSLSIREIAESVSDDRKTKFGGLHFFNPVPMMKLLEVVKVDDMTSTETFEILENYGKFIGQTTVKCSDTPGFLVNRLLVPYMFEAVRLHERGHGSIKDIDIAMKLGAGHPMGPFELMDYTGFDTGKSVVDGWREKDPENQLWEASPLINKLVSEGKVGIKAGEGFYDYKKK